MTQSIIGRTLPAHSGASQEIRMQMSTPTEERIRSVGDVEINVRIFPPAGPARAAVVICHGVNSHGGQYLWSAGQLASAGLAPFALDLRGRGKSGGPRYYVDDVAQYVADVAAAIGLAKSRHPGIPVFLIGHSAGGVVSSTYALDHASGIAGLVCESFAFKVPAPDAVLALIKGLSRIAPRLPVLKLRNEDFSRDPVAVGALNSDPLTAGEVQPARTVAALVRANERLRREFPRITLPLFILHGTADKATLPAGSQFFFDTAGSKDKTLKLYDGHFHDLLNDVGKDAVLADIRGWIDARITPPSR
jgi:alpha-beta hydrolase superfamily lysophospholipase